MLQVLKKLKLYTKLGPETVHKYSHQNIFVITWRADFVSEILTHTTVLGLTEKVLLFPGKMLVCGRSLHYLEVNGI